MAILVLLTGWNSFAQKNTDKIKDDLLKHKDSLLSTYVPMIKKKYSIRFFNMSPVELRSKLSEFRTSLLKQGGKDGDPEVSALRPRDADYFIRNVVADYQSSYGRDSMAVVRFREISEKLKNSPNGKKSIDSAARQIYLKKLSDAEKEILSGILLFKPDLNDGILFRRSSAYRQWLDKAINERRPGKSKTGQKLGIYGISVQKINVVLQEIKDPFIREYLNYQSLRMILGSKPGPEEDKLYKDFMAFAINPAYRKELETIYENSKKVLVNAQSPDFSYADVNNKQVSLKDFQGKYLYIDIWATWCKPCIAQIPSLRKVEHDYEGKGISFVSISVDAMKDKPKWLAYVKEHQMTGIQLMADKDFDSDFIRKFNINSIPRFILIDPEGKIVDGNAKRPSDPELRKQLDKLLK